MAIEVTIQNRDGPTGSVVSESPVIVANTETDESKEIHSAITPTEEIVVRDIALGLGSPELYFMGLFDVNAASFANNDIVVFDETTNTLMGSDDITLTNLTVTGVTDLADLNFSGAIFINDLVVSGNTDLNIVTMVDAHANVFSADVATIISGNVVTLTSNDATIQTGNVVNLTSDDADITNADIGTANVAILISPNIDIGLASIDALSSANAHFVVGSADTFSANVMSANTFSVDVFGANTVNANVATIVDFFVTANTTMNIVDITSANIVDGTANTFTVNNLLMTTPRQFSIAGDIVAPAVNFDGSGNVILQATYAPNSVVLGVDTFGSYVKDMVLGANSALTLSGGTAAGASLTINTIDATTSGTVGVAAFDPANFTIAGRTVSVSTIDGTQTKINMDHSDVPSFVPTFASLTDGELFVNIPDDRVYYRNGVDVSVLQPITKVLVDSLLIDAQTLMGLDSTQFLRSDIDNTYTNDLTFSATTGGVVLPSTTVGNMVKLGVTSGNHVDFVPIALGVPSKPIRFDFDTDLWFVENLYSTTGVRYLTTDDSGSGGGFNAEFWDGNAFPDFMNQPVRTTDNVIFGNVTASLTGNVTGTVSSIANHTTYDLAEDENLYYTEARANAAIDARVDKTYVDGLNIDAQTIDGLDSTAFVLQTQVTDASLNPIFDATIGFGVNSEVLRYRDIADTTRTDYWVNKDKLSFTTGGVAGDLVASFGHLETANNAYFAGKVGIGVDLDVGGNVTIAGDLTVSGTTTTIDTEQLQVKDAIIAMNTGQSTPLNDIGMLFHRYATPTIANYNVAVVWNEINDRFIWGKTVETGDDNLMSFHEEMATLTDTKRFGLGIAAPQYDIHVVNTAPILATENSGGAISQFGISASDKTFLDNISGSGLELRIGSTAHLNVSTSGDVRIGDATAARVKLDIDGPVLVEDHHEIGATTIILSTLVESAIFSMPIATYDSAKVEIVSINGSERHISELLIIHDGTTAHATEYGVIHTGVDVLADYDVSIVGPNLVMTATSKNATATTFRIMYRKFRI